MKVEMAAPATTSYRPQERSNSVGTNQLYLHGILLSTHCLVSKTMMAIIDCVVCRRN